MNKILTALLFFLFSIFSTYTKAQEWKIKNYNAAYRFFEIENVGNNPLSVWPLLKDPTAYQKYLNTIKFNCIYGNPSIQDLNTFYINAEWQKNNSLSRFWKKYTIETGILFTGKITQDIGGIGEQSYYSSPDTNMYVNMYWLTRKQQYLGIHAGLNRRFSLSKKLKFFTGLHAQESIVIVHHYQQMWDSSTFTPSSGWKKNQIQMANLKGKNFLQWQVMVPIALEYAIYKQKYFIRLEADVGIMGGRYQHKPNLYNESHGVGLSFIYAP